MLIQDVENAVLEQHVANFYTSRYKQRTLS